MWFVRVRQTHRLSAREARRRIDRAVLLAEERYSVIWRWVDDALEVLPPPGRAQGVSGRLEIASGAVRAEVALPAGYGLLRRAVATRLARELEELLAC
jgi:hypothetical protein